MSAEVLSAQEALPSTEDAARMSSMRTCSKCGELQALAAFSKDSRRLSGVRAQCRRCDAQRATEWQRQNRTRYLAAKASYRADNIEKVRAGNRAWASKATERLSDTYVLRALKARQGDLPTALIDLKREQLSLRRLTLELTQELENHDGN